MIRHFKAFIQLARPWHWIKNLFVFLPAFFGGKLLDSDALVQSLLAFISLSLAASAVYGINDVCDRKKDANHPQKRLRPVARIVPRHREGKTCVNSKTLRLIHPR